VYAMTPSAHEDAVMAITAALEAGRLVHDVGTVLPLERIAEAHELVEASRGGGQVVLEP